MELKIINIKDEKIGIFTFFDPRTRNQEVTLWHQKVHNFLNIPINYIKIDYRFINHGNAMTNIIKSLYNNIDYFCFLDNDAIILRQNALSEICDKLRDGRTVFGGAQNSNHININPTHPFVQPSTFCISSKLYKTLGEPSLSDGVHQRSDTCEEVTWLCQERGYNVCIVYPTHFHWLTEEESKSSGNPTAWRLTDKLYYGLGTTYGDIFFHAGMQSLPRSFEVFKNKCNEIMGLQKKVECVICCKDYGSYLELTLKENKKYFDHIIVVTSWSDRLTQELCRTHNATCVIYDEWNLNGAVFNKGGALNCGLRNLKYKDWVVILDSDIIIKEDFREKFNDKNKFYGSYRRFIPTLNDFKMLSKVNYNAWLNEKDKFEKIEGSGCGFFQGIHYSRLQFFNERFGYMYPNSYSADQVDIDFLRQFCLFRNDEYDNLERMNIELWHLGPHGLNHEGVSEKDLFFTQ